jgi:hypothetical protein
MSLREIIHELMFFNDNILKKDYFDKVMASKNESEIILLEELKNNVTFNDKLNYQILLLLLAELKSKNSIPLLCKFLTINDDKIENICDAFLTEYLPIILISLCENENDLNFLLNLVENTSHNKLMQQSVYSILPYFVKQHKLDRTTVLKLVENELNHILQIFVEPPVKEKNIVPNKNTLFEKNGKPINDKNYEALCFLSKLANQKIYEHGTIMMGILDVCTELQLIELLPILEKMWNKDIIDPLIMGNLDEITKYIINGKEIDDIDDIDSISTYDELSKWCSYTTKISKNKKRRNRKKKHIK